jgi:hypothetical protein
VRIIGFEIREYLGTERVGTITFERGTDPRIRNESDFYHKLRKLLRKMDFDVIKKLGYKDGHLIDEHIYIVRSRHLNRNGFVIYDDRYALRLVHEDFNTEGKVQLTIQYWAGKDKHARPLRALGRREEQHQDHPAPVR